MPESYTLSFTRNPLETLQVSPTGVGNVGDFSKTFLSFFYEGMSKIASTQIVPLKNVFVKPDEQSQAPLELCHGEKTKNEIQRFR